MLSFIRKRAVASLISLVGLIVMVFFLSRLTGDPANPRAVGSRDASLDVSQALDAYGAEMAGQLTDICGYIFMQKSPSCGLERVKVYQDNGHPAVHGGRGVYAQAFCALRAAAKAVSRSPCVEAGTLASSSPLAGLNTSARRG